MKNPEVIVIGYMTEEKHLSERVIDRGGISFTLMAMTHGYGQGFVMESTPNETEQQ